MPKYLTTIPKRKPSSATKKLSDAQRNFIAQKVLALGSLDAVCSHYNIDDLVSKYARWLGGKLFKAPSTAA